MMCPESTSSRRNCAGGGAMNFDATSTRDTLAMIRLGTITRPEASRLIPATSITHNGQREVEKGRGFDQRDASAEIEVDHGRFQLGLAGAMNQVHPERKRIAGEFLDTVNRVLDRPEREPGRAEDPQEAASGHRFDNFDRADAVGHCARHAGKSQAVPGPKLRVSQVFKPTAWNRRRQAAAVIARAARRELFGRDFVPA